MKHRPTRPTLAGGVARALARTVTLCLALSTAGAGAARAQGDSELSNASRTIGGGASAIVAGSLQPLAAIGSGIVVGARMSGEGLELVLKGASDASTATVRLSGQAAEGLSLAAGTVVDVVALSGGHLLVLSGKVLAFIPNELGKALLHHERAA